MPLRFLSRTVFAALCIAPGGGLLAVPGRARAEETLRFNVTLDPAVAKQPITGRLYVFLSTRAGREPMRGPNWFNPEPFFGIDVVDFAPGESRAIDAASDGFPDKLPKLKPGEYRIQALLDHSFHHPHHAKGVGNFYSKVLAAKLQPGQTGSISLKLDQLIEATAFPESKWVKEIVLPSKLLSDFHRREVVEYCGVALPRSYYDQPKRRYPVLYIIPGFGGGHRSALRYKNGGPELGEGEAEFIRVMLNGRCKWGHHVYADSATNGPRGAALVREMIPHIDATFRTVAAPTARFLNGHSSGGWSSLWLQVAYPDFFGGVWSTSPDPVDFRDYQNVNLYAKPPLSLYVDEAGGRRPIARRGGKPVLWYDSFGKMDDCLKRGGQLRSFEAVFSPLGKDGLPRKLWDRKTGRIDPEVARAWEAYDIRLKLERNWKTLGPKLAGKLHIVIGELDTFYLEGAVRQLKGALKEIGSDAEIEIVPGASHGSVVTAKLIKRIRRQMSQAFFKHHPSETPGDAK